MSQHHIIFRVAAVSSNHNSFGLRGHVLVSRTGLACELALSDLNSKPRGTRVRVPVSRIHVSGKPDALASAAARHLHGEIPRDLPKAPAKIAREVWK